MSSRLHLVLLCVSALFAFSDANADPESRRIFPSSDGEVETDDKREPYCEQQSFEGNLLVGYACGGIFVKDLEKFNGTTFPRDLYLLPCHRYSGDRTGWRIFRTDFTSGGKFGLVVLEAIASDKEEKHDRAPPRNGSILSYLEMFVNSVRFPPEITASFSPYPRKPRELQFYDVKETAKYSTVFDKMPRDPIASFYFDNRFVFKEGLYVQTSNSFAGPFPLSPEYKKRIGQVFDLSYKNVAGTNVGGTRGWVSPKEKKNDVAAAANDWSVEYRYRRNNEANQDEKSETRFGSSMLASYKKYDVILQRNMPPPYNSVPWACMIVYDVRRGFFPQIMLVPKEIQLHTTRAPPTTTKATVKALDGMEQCDFAKSEQILIYRKGHCLILNQPDVPDFMTTLISCGEDLKALQLSYSVHKGQLVVAYITFQPETNRNELHLLRLNYPETEVVKLDNYVSVNVPDISSALEEGIFIHDGGIYLSTGGCANADSCTYESGLQPEGGEPVDSPLLQKALFRHQSGDHIWAKISPNEYVLSNGNESCRYTHEGTTLNDPAIHVDLLPPKGHYQEQKKGLNDHEKDGVNSSVKNAALGSVLFVFIAVLSY